MTADQPSNAGALLAAMGAAGGSSGYCCIACLQSIADTSTLADNHIT